MESVAWGLLGKSLQWQCHNNQIQLIKFMHNWLNTGAQKQEFDEHAANCCPVCGTATETWEHLFQCDHDNKMAMKLLSLTRCKINLTKLKTSPTIKTVLLFKIGPWMHLPSQEVPQLCHNDLGPAVGAAVEEQSELEWDNFLKGRILIKWGAVQQLFYDIFHVNNITLTQQCWQEHTIVAIWHIFFTLWQTRNLHLHQKVSDHANCTLNSEITWAYNTLSHSMCQSDKLLFTKPLEDRLTNSSEAVRIAVHDFQHVHKGSTMQQTITDFFKTCHKEQADLSTDPPVDWNMVVAIDSDRPNFY
eukprot:4763391-Ditylum_brightwellii.AAC.1